MFFFLFYFFLRITYYSSDSINYALSIEEGAVSSHNFWRMEHPLWEITGRGAYLLGALLGFKGNTLELMQLLNAVCGSLAVAFFFLIIFRLTKSLKTSLFCAFLLGFSYYFWFWNAEVKFYSLAALFVMLTIYFFTAESFLAPAGTLLTGFFFALAMLYHSANMVLFLPLTIAFFLNASPLKKKFSSYMLFLAAILVFFVIPHLIILIKFSGINMLDIVTGKTPLTWFGVAPRLAGVGIHEHILKLPLFLNLLSASLVCRGIEAPAPELQLDIQLAYFGLFLIIVMLLFIKFNKKIMEKHCALSFLCLLWILLQAAAMWLVDPYNYYIYIVLIPVIILLSLGLQELLNFYPVLKTVSTALMTTSLIALLTSNYLIGIKQCRGENEALVKMKYYSQYIDKADTVVFLGLSNDHEYARYYLKCRVINIFQFFLDSPFQSTENVLEQIKSGIDFHLSEGRVLLDGDIIEGNLIQPQNAPPNMNMDQIKKFFLRNYRFKPYFIYYGRKILKLEIFKQGIHRNQTNFGKIYLERILCNPDS
ncbi:MAG: glycosyltransferase family 39 protein [Firmicutes bacterium]|nr:glycosyltransferase family 39 protein [Bacillota bacterium]